MSQNDPNSPQLKSRRGLKAALRRLKVIELAAQGKTNQQIADILKVGEKTVDRDMQSVQIQEYTHGLVKRQIQDIETSKPGVRLHYRSDLIEKLLPKRAGDKVEVNVNANATSTSESASRLLGEYDAIIAAEVAKEKRTLQPDDSAEQVHPAQASDSA
ncbi:MAG: LuxR C-terminal-related transcriptional regulator [Candidatus Bathyarchaeia archaeon]|jgi:DNA-binding CsgD family transcriptional regulator